MKKFKYYQQKLYDFIKHNELIAIDKVRLNQDLSALLNQFFIKHHSKQELQEFYKNLTKQDRQYLKNSFHYDYDKLALNYIDASDWDESNPHLIASMNVYYLSKNDTITKLVHFYDAEINLLYHFYKKFIIKLNQLYPNFFDKNLSQIVSLFYSEYGFNSLSLPDWYESIAFKYENSGYILSSHIFHKILKHLRQNHLIK